MTEAVLLVGRGLFAAAALIFPVTYTVAASGAIAIAGSVGLAFTTRMRGDRIETRGDTHRTITTLVDARHILAAFVLWSASLGAFSLVLVSVFDGERAGATWSATSIAAWGSGSLVGVGILTRAQLRSRRIGPVTLLIAMGVLQLFTAVIPVAYGPAVIVTAFVAGLPIAAIATALYALLEKCTPPSLQSGTFAWAWTGILAGDAVGAALAVAAIDQWSVGGAVLLAAGLVAIAALAARRAAAAT